jgi:hypothetical protein
MARKKDRQEKRWRTRGARETIHREIYMIYIHSYADIVI